MATVRSLLLDATDIPSEDPRRDAEIILCHVLDKNRAWLYTWPEAEVDEAMAEHYSRLLAARRRGTPVAHLTGTREFWSLELEVNEHTLIPRVETETLVEWALSLEVPANASVVDLGTGSGAIALALASERQQWSVAGVDSSKTALQVARGNAVRLDLNDVVFTPSDWFSALAEKRFDLIVSNPPYIDAQDSHLGQGDLPFEPLSALVADDQGLADIVRIILGAPQHLSKGGWLLLEHGFDQADQVRELFAHRGFDAVESRCDLAGIERITGGQWNAE